MWPRAGSRFRPTVIRNFRWPRHMLELILGLDRNWTAAMASCFSYRSIETDVLAFCLERATGKRLPQLVSEEIWQKMGAEESACFTVDRRAMRWLRRPQRHACATMAASACFISSMAAASFRRTGSRRRAAATTRFPRALYLRCRRAPTGTSAGSRIRGRAPSWPAACSAR